MTAGATAPGDKAYNRPVKRPYPASSEAMWRDDSLYDLVVVLGYNDDARSPGMGLGHLPAPGAPGLCADRGLRRA